MSWIKTCSGKNIVKTAKWERVAGADGRIASASISALVCEYHIFRKEYILYYIFAVQFSRVTQ